MPIDRTELERLLADRPSGQRSAMQAVRDSYADIGLMRERGLSWAEISDVLARLGVTARDNQPIAPVTLRSAFFLVGNEMRGDESGEAAADSADAVHRAALVTAVRQVTDARMRDDAAAKAEPNAGMPGEQVPSASPEAVSAGDRDAESVALEPDVTEEATAGLSALDDAPVPSVPDGAEVPASLPAAEPGTAETASAPPELAPAETAEPEPAVPDLEPEPDLLPVSPPEPAVAASASVFTSPDPPPHVAENIYWKGDRMLGTIFVLNDRGGVGKTLLSHHLMATAMLEGLQLKVVEYEVNERLARLYGAEVVEHRKITQDFMNLMGSGDGFYEFWDQIGPELQRGGRLFDFGGNISQWFFNWAEVSGFDYYVGEGERLTFMVPVTVDLASLQTGMATLERVATIAPKAKRVLVENGVSGPFSQLEDSNYGRRRAEMIEREGVHVISMPPCTAPAWARLTGHRLDQVATMTREDLAKLGMTPPVASRSLIIIHEWLRTMRQTLAPYLHDAFRQSAAVGGKPVGSR